MKRLVPLLLVLAILVQALTFLPVGLAMAAGADHGLGGVICLSPGSDGGDADQGTTSHDHGSCVVCVGGWTPALLGAGPELPMSIGFPSRTQIFEAALVQAKASLASYSSRAPPVSL